MTSDQVRAILDAGTYPADHHAAAEQFNAENHVALLSEARTTELGIVNAFADPAAGEGCLQKLEAAAAVNPLLARMLKWIKPGAEGLDFANPKVRANLDQFVVATVITAEEATTLKSLGETVAVVTAAQIREARQL